MPDKYDDNRRLTKEIHKQEKLEKERIETAKQIVRNLEDQKRIEREHLDLVDKHQNYWYAEIKKTKETDRERYEGLKEKLEREKEIRNKILDHIKHLDKEIKIQKEHIP